MILFAAYVAARRAMAEDQRHHPHASVGFWRLLVGEIALLARRVGLGRVIGVATLVTGAVVAVEVGLSTDTPGPTLASPWRWIVAATVAAATVCVWAVLHALRSTSRS